MTDALSAMFRGVLPERTVGDVRREKANVTLEGLHSDRAFYNDKKKGAEKAKLQELQKIARAKPLPSEYGFTSSLGNNDVTGARSHILNLTHEGTVVGHIGWNGETGRVSHLTVDADHRNYVPHLILGAHKLARNAGDTGPTHSEELSKYGYNVAKRHASAFMPENVKVDGMNRDDWEQIDRDYAESQKRAGKA